MDPFSFATYTTRTSSFNSDVDSPTAYTDVLYESPYKRNKREESEEEEGQQKVLSGKDSRTMASDGRGGGRIERRALFRELSGSVCYRF